MAKYTAVFIDQDDEVFEPVLIIYARTLREVEKKAWAWMVEEIADETLGPPENVIRDMFELKIKGPPEEIF
jgi:hypothetical protein